MVNFVYYHFLANEVVFDDGNSNGFYKTNYTYTDTIDNTEVNALIEISGDPQNLTLVDGTGKVVTVDHDDANVLVRQGTMHKINAVLQYEEE
jgi:hypothetical protein